MKKAFTMLELVFVIVIIGILAAVIIPRTGSNKLAEAAVQVVSHIQYTQHLAMVDDKFDDSNTSWFRARWQIYFHADSGNQVYSIYSDINLNNSPNPAAIEIALDPLSKKRMSGHTMYDRTPNMDLSESYGINNINFNLGCAGVQRIYFDHLGRPHIGNAAIYGDLLATRCEIILFSPEGNISIFIEPETGYAHLL